MDRIKNLCGQIDFELKNRYPIYEKKQIRKIESNYKYILKDDYLFPQYPIFLNETILFLGITRNNFRAVEYSCRHYAFRSLTCKYGRNAISYAVECSDFNIIKYLINSQFPVFNLNGFKFNPIIEAFQLNRLDIAEYLIQNTPGISKKHFDLLISFFEKDSNRLEIIKKIPVVQIPDV